MNVSNDIALAPPVVDFEYEQGIIKLIEKGLKGYQLIENKCAVNHETYYDWLYKKLDVKDHTTVLEYASALGHFWEHTKDQLNLTASYHLVDPSKIGMKFSKQVCEGISLPIHLNQMSLYQLDYCNHYFDTVFSDVGFALISEEKRVKALTEMNRVLKPGGKILFALQGKAYIEGLSDVCQCYGEVTNINPKHTSTNVGMQQEFKSLEGTLFESVTFEEYVSTYEVANPKVIMNMLISLKGKDKLIDQIIYQNKVTEFAKDVKTHVDQAHPIRLTRRVTLVTCQKAK